MDPRKLSRAELVALTANAATGIADGKVSGFLAEQNTAFSDELTDKGAVLSAADGNIVQTRAASQEATQIGEAATEDLLLTHSHVHSAMKSVGASAAEYEALGYDAPDTTRTPVNPQTPTDLVAMPVATGANEMKWVGNNAPGSVTYMIEAKIGDTAPYVIVGTSTSQKFRHSPVIRGEFYQYHVRAQSARNLVSDWSNEAVCYGM